MVVEADENRLSIETGPNQIRKDREKTTSGLEIEVQEADSALRNNENDELSVAAKISDSQIWWIGAAMTDQETCLDGLGREESRSIALVWRGRESVSDNERGLGFFIFF